MACTTAAGNHRIAKVAAPIARDCAIAGDSISGYPFSMARYLSRDTEPLGKWKGIPIYLTTILTALLVAGLILTAVLTSAHSPWLTRLKFNVPASSWTEWLSVLSYPFIEPVNFFAPLALMCFYWWAVGIESHLGRAPLACLLTALVLVPAAFLSIVSLIDHSPGRLAGNFFVVAGLLVAFATLYPKTEWFGWIPYKYLAFAAILCGSLMLVADRDWLGVADLWLVCVVSFFYTRHAIEKEYDDHVPLGARIRSWFRRRPAFRVVPRTRAETPSTLGEMEDDDKFGSEVDALLEKIARNGLASLSARERERLEQAREELLKKDRK